MTDKDNSINNEEPKRDKKDLNDGEWIKKESIKTNNDYTLNEATAPESNNELREKEGGERQEIQKDQENWDFEDLKNRSDSLEKKVKKKWINKSKIVWIVGGIIFFIILGASYYFKEDIPFDRIPMVWERVDLFLSDLPNIKEKENKKDLEDTKEETNNENETQDNENEINNKNETQEDSSEIKEDNAWESTENQEQANNSKENSETIEYANSFREITSTKWENTLMLLIEKINDMNKDWFIKKSDISLKWNFMLEKDNLNQIEKQLSTLLGVNLNLRTRINSRNNTPLTLMLSFAKENETLFQKALSVNEAWEIKEKNDHSWINSLLWKTLNIQQTNKDYSNFIDSFSKVLNNKVDSEWMLYLYNSTSDLLGSDTMIQQKDEKEFNIKHKSFLLNIIIDNEQIEVISIKENPIKNIGRTFEYKNNSFSIIFEKNDNMIGVFKE